MQASDHKTLLDEAHAQALAWLDGLRDRRVMSLATASELAPALDVPLPAEPGDALAVLRELATGIDPGLTAMPSGRFFGWVIGGTYPVALGADWLVSAWDQNAAMHEPTPGTALVEQVAGRWVLELLGLPEESSLGFVTGAQMANLTCLAAARNAVLARAGWDVEAEGLQGGPRVTVVVGEQVHGTVPRALRVLGLGGRRAVAVAVDGEGRMRPSALAEVLAGVDGPVIVCAQAGEVNSGAFDPFDELMDVAAAHGAWVHVDGAFGLWAAVDAERRHLVEGVDRADSWCTDAHKMLNTPYDCGIAIVRDREAHRRAMGVRAAYLPEDDDPALRSPIDWNPEFSRRARSVPVYAVLRWLGRQGVADLVNRLCGLAGMMAERLAALDGVEVLNDVVLNQVLVRFSDDDDHTRQVLARVREDGTCFMSGTTWFGRAAMRISVSNWSTDPDDVARSVEAIRSAHTC